MQGDCSKPTLFCAKDQQRNNSSRKIFFNKPASKLFSYCRVHI